METQPTQPGLMQLFTSLGLATNNPLNPLDSVVSDGEAGKALGFEGILADYLPAQTDSSSGLLTANSLSPAPTEPPLTEVMIVDSSQLGAETLPPLGQSLPLMAPLTQDTAMIVPASIKEAASQSQELSLLVEGSAEEITEESDTLLTGQGYYAQSLVSSILPTKESSISSLNSGAAANPHGMVAAASNLDMRHGIRSSLSNKPTEQVGMNLNSGVEEDPGLEVSTDRFLGARGTSDQPLAKTRMDSTPPMQQVLNTLQGSPAQASASSDASLVVVSLNEDPTHSSEDLVYIEDAEKAEVDAKLTMTERKQDDQVLRLSKGQQAWGDALSERISMNAAKDIKQVTIHLDPPELGSLELKLQIKDDQQTQVQVQVQNPQVKEALESSAQRLRDMLANQGMELSEFDVQTGSEQSRQQAQQDSDKFGSESSPRDSDALASDEELSLEVALPKNNNLLDTFV
jgi:flagellar hook-length control protein FliK